MFFRKCLLTMRQNISTKELIHIKWPIMRRNVCHGGDVYQMAQIRRDCFTSMMSNTVLACISIQFSDIYFNIETNYI